jgi:hypothetical protein
VSFEDVVPIVTAAVAVSGAYLAVLQFVGDRRKDRHERAATALRTSLDQLTSDDDRKQLMAFVALEHYFTDDNREFHEQALSALMAVARSEYQAWNANWDRNVATDPSFQTPPRLRNLSLAVERALRALAAAAPHRVEAIVAAQSLQRVALPELDLHGLVPTTILKGRDSPTRGSSAPTWPGSISRGAGWRTPASKVPTSVAAASTERSWCTPTSRGPISGAPTSSQPRRSRGSWCRT